MVFSRRALTLAAAVLIAAVAVLVVAATVDAGALFAALASGAPLLANALLIEKRQTRGQHVAAMRTILDKAEGEKRALTAEEKQEYERLDAEQERLAADITRQERQAALDTELAQHRTDPVRPEPEQGRAGQVPEAFRALYDAAEAQLRARLDVLGGEAHRKAFRGWIPRGRGVFDMAEYRDLQAEVFTGGGALVAPLEFTAGLIKFIDDLVFIRALATKYTVTMADALGVASLDTDPSDASWTNELGTGAADTAMAFGRRELRPYPLAKRIKISNKLMRLSPAVENLVLSRLGYKFAITQEKAFLTGNGANQPLGVFTASTDGIPTTRDVSTGNTTTAIGSDGLIEAKYSIKGAYWPRLQWVFHRDAMKQIRKLKDGNGQYIWQPGLSGGQPDRVLDSPFNMSEYAPNTFTTGLYVGVIGDFSNYWIVDALDFTVQRLVELYAETNQTGFIGRMESDGQPVLAEAFARVKLA